MLLCSTASVALAGLEGRWFHVRVEEHGEDGEYVNINLPLQLVESLLPTIETDEFSHGKITIDDADLEGIDLRAALTALRDTPDGEFVTVRSKDESVRVAKENGLLVIHAEEADDERVRVQMPLEVVDAMLATGENELDLLAGLYALADYDGGDLITVQSDDSYVRIWIDSSEDGQ
jgi:hypothetical protein